MVAHTECSACSAALLRLNGPAVCIIESTSQPILDPVRRFQKLLEKATAELLPCGAGRRRGCRSWASQQCPERSCQRQTMSRIPRTPVSSGRRPW